MKTEQHSAVDAPGARRRDRLFVVGVLVVSVVCGVATFRWVQPEPAASTAAEDTGSNAVVEPIVVPTPRPATAEGIEQFRADLRERFGDAVVDEAYLSAEIASFDKALRDSPNRVVSYTYRGGISADRDPVTRDVDTPVFDLSTVDVPLLARYLAGAPQSTGVPDGTVNSISLETTEHGNVVRISVSNPAQESGSITLSPEGNLLSVSEFAP